MHNAEDEGEARHQNGPQAKAGGFNRSLSDAFAGIFKLFGELDDENRVLAGETDQHDEADLGEDVVIHVPQPDAGDGAEQAHRHDEDDSQWQTPAFVLRGEGEEYEEDTEREDEYDGVAGQNFLIRQVGPFVVHARRQFLGGQLLREGDGLAGTDARHGHAIDVRGGVHVVTDDFVRAGGFANVHERAERHHVAGGIAGFEFRNVLGVNTEVRVGLRRHLIRSAKAVEVIYVEGAKIDLERVVHIAQGNVHALGLHAVHIHENLRHARGKGGEHLRKPWRLAAVHHRAKGRARER